MKKLICAALCALALLSLVSCASKNDGIAGSWETVADYNGESVSLTYEFFEDGTGRYETEGFSADRFTYEVSRSNVVITVGDSQRTIPFFIEKDILVLDIDGQSIRFQKK